MDGGGVSVTRELQSSDISTELIVGASEICVEARMISAAFELLSLENDTETKMLSIEIPSVDLVVTRCVVVASP